MAIEQDIERVARQEERLRFPGFDANTAWTVGTRIRALAASIRALVNEAEPVIEPRQKLKKKVTK